MKDKRIIAKFRYNQNLYTALYTLYNTPEKYKICRENSSNFDFYWIFILGRANFLIKFFKYYFLIVIKF